MDIVLPMGWVSSPPFFCAASETTADLTNGYIADNRSPTSEYSSTPGVYSTILYSPASAAPFQAKDIYMDDLNFLSQGSPAQQRRVAEMVLQGIKDIVPSLPNKIKDSIIFNRAWQGDGDWDVQN